jgi:hypothetical protein
MENKVADGVGSLDGVRVRVVGREEGGVDLGDEATRGGVCPVVVSEVVLATTTFLVGRLRRETKEKEKDREERLEKEKTGRVQGRDGGGLDEPSIVLAGRHFSRSGE